MSENLVFKREVRVAWQDKVTVVGHVASTEEWGELTMAFVSAEAAENEDSNIAQARFAIEMAKVGLRFVTRVEGMDFKKNTPFDVSTFKYIPPSVLVALATAIFNEASPAEEK